MFLPTDDFRRVKNESCATNGAATGRLADFRDTRAHTRIRTLPRLHRARKKCKSSK